MMGYQVISYEVAEQLMFQDSIFREYSDAIHITATNSLKRGMMESNSGLSPWFHGPILSFSELSKFLGNAWFLGQTEVKQFTLLSKVLRKYNESNQNHLSELFSAIDKNQEIVFNTMRLLVECGLSSHDVKKATKNNLSDEEIIFLDLWNELEQEGAFTSFRTWFHDFKESTIDTFKNTLLAALTDLGKSDKNRINANMLENPNILGLVTKQFVKRKVIVLHGFYFILPIQKRIFDQLSKHITVIHVVNYKEGYQNGFQAVETFLDLPNTTHRQASKTKLPVNSVAKRFLEVINGIFPGEDAPSTTKKKPNYFEFMNLHQFKNYIESEDDVVVSPRSREVKSYLEDVNTAKNHKLTQYPMGQFLLDVHRLNTRKYQIESRTYQDVENLSMPLVLRLFNSGYLIIDGEPAAKYVKSLRKLTPILENASTFKDWQKQLRELHLRKMSVEKGLKHPLANKDLDHRMYTYYNRNLAFFNVPIKDLKAIKKGLNYLRKLYKSLYSGNSVKIQEYVEILENFVAKDVLPTLQQEVDKKVANKILESMEDLKGLSIDSFDRQDLMRGLNLFLSRKTEVDEYQEELHSHNGVNDFDTVSAMLTSDGVQFTENRSVHFALMDNKAFPTSQQLSAWPLSKETLEELYSNVNLKQLKMRKDLEIDIACYLLYIIMNNAINVKFSIVKELNQEKKLQPSFYLQLLNLVKSTEKDILQSGISQQSIQRNISKKITFHQRAYEILIRKTYNRCPKRVVYSFLMNKRPEFSSSFHEPFVFQNLLMLVANSSKNDLEKKGGYKQVGSWFPHWPKTKKEMYRQNIDEYMRRNITQPNYTWLDGYLYLDAQVHLALFGQASPNEVQDRAEYNFDQSDKPFANPGPHCKYCPFQEQCIDATLYE